MKQQLEKPDEFAEFVRYIIIYSGRQVSLGDIFKNLN